MTRLTTSSGYEIGYCEAGGGEATPIVFLHGVGSDKSVWQPQLDYFRGQRRAIAFDYPGYGESDSVRSGTTRNDYASAVISGMDKLGVNRAHICGLSLGGVVALALHHASPARCASLVLADTFAVHPDGRAIYERSLAGSRNLRGMAEARVDFLIAAPADPAVRREVVETMARIDPRAYRIGAEAVWLADQRELARAVQVAALVLVGEEDRVTPPELSRELVSLINDARLEVIAGAGHLSNLEKPSVFNPLVKAFIESVEEAR